MSPKTPAKTSRTLYLRTEEWQSGECGRLETIYALSFAKISSAQKMGFIPRRNDLHTTRELNQKAFLIAQIRGSTR